MDEPFSALDPLIRRDMQNLFLSIQGEVKRTVVFVTHDLDEALTLGHRVAIMKDGEIVQLGTPEYILTEPANEYVERFVEDVDYAKVRTAESVMVQPKEVAYINEGPTVVLRRMRQAGLSHIFVAGQRAAPGRSRAKPRRSPGSPSATSASSRTRSTTAAEGRAEDAAARGPAALRGDGDAPVAVVDEGDRLEGVIVRGALIAGLTTSIEPHDEDVKTSAAWVPTRTAIGVRARGRGVEMLAQTCSELSQAYPSPSGPRARSIGSPTTSNGSSSLSTR